jgi:hypothetical protein
MRASPERRGAVRQPPGIEWHAKRHYRAIDNGQGWDLPWGAARDGPGGAPARRIDVRDVSDACNSER